MENIYKTTNKIMKICSKCKQEKSLDKFYKLKKRYENQTVFHTARCKKCTNEVNVSNSKKYEEYYSNYRKNNKEAAAERSKLNYKRKKENWLKFLAENIELKCQVQSCGYDKCFAALDFHHRNPEEKEYGIYDLMKMAFNEKNKSILLAEIKKCDVLCANCHRERHYYETE
jgi:hypothetical protein